MLRKLLIALSSLLLILIVVISSLLFFIDLNSYKPEISDSVKLATGRDLQIIGPIELDIGITPTIVLNNIALGNNKKTVHSNIAETEKIEVKLSLFSLLSGDFTVKSILLHKPVIWLERDEAGEGNWSGKESAEPLEQTEAGNKLTSIPLVKITDGKINFYEEKTKRSSIYLINEFETYNFNLSDIFSFKLNAKIEEQSVNVKGSINSLDRMLNQEQSELNFEIGYANHRINLSANANILDQDYSFQGVKVNINDNKIEGDINYITGSDIPLIKSRIQFEELDYFSIFQAAQASQSTSIFSNEPFNLEALRNLNADIAINGKKIIFDKLDLNNISVKIDLSGNKLNVDSNIKVNDGSLNGLFEFEFNQNIPSLNAQITGKHLKLGQLIKVTGNKEFITGASSKLSIKLKSSGISSAQLAGNVNGNVFIDVGKGKILNENINLVGGDLTTQLFTSLDPSAKKNAYTDLECAVVNLQFKKGISVYDKNIAAMTDNMAIISSGVIDLKNETLDMGFSPKPRKDTTGLGINVGELVSVARLTGKLTDPQLSLDAANTAKAGAKVYGAIATGGISLLIDGLVSKFTADSNPCESARQKNGTKQTKKKAPGKKSGLRELFNF